MHPRWLRCSSLKYSRYSRSSRLAIRAPRSAIWSLFSVNTPLVTHPIFARGGRLAIYLAIVVVFFSALVDVVVAWLDPRLRQPRPST